MNTVANMFDRRVRGFRVIELIGFASVIALILSVYLFKGMAGAEGAQIADTTRQIAEEQHKVRALRAEVARLESPERLERLSTQYLGMQAVSAKQEAQPETVADVMRRPSLGVPGAASSAAPAAHTSQ
jgi:cell division protein FtsL